MIRRLYFAAFLALLPTQTTGAPLCAGRVVRTIEFTGRECAGICRVLRKQITFVGEKILYGASSTNQGIVFLLNGQTDLQHDQFNLPDLPGPEFPGTRSVGTATSSVSMPNISLSVSRQLLSPANQVVADYRENLKIRLNDRCDECEVVQYQYTFTGKGSDISSVFRQYSCRVGP